MKARIRVLIADPNEDFQLLMRDLIQRENGMELAGTATDGLDALAKIDSLHPDVVLLELVQPRLDGLGVLRRLAKKPSAPPVLVLTGFVNPAVVSECAGLGATYFMPKPCDSRELLRQLCRCAEIPPQAKPTTAAASAAAPAMDDGTLRNAISDILHEIGVPAHLKGYRYLREAILLTLSDSDATNGITKVIYPEIAKRYSATPGCIERAIRHAVEIAWDRGDAETLREFFGSADADRPTNSFFIAAVADRLSLQYGKGL